jgi:hypothetical protein
MGVRLNRRHGSRAKVTLRKPRSGPRELRHRNPGVPVPSRNLPRLSCRTVVESRRDLKCGRTHEPCFTCELTGPVRLLLDRRTSRHIVWKRQRRRCSVLAVESKTQQAVGLYGAPCRHIEIGQGVRTEGSGNPCFRGLFGYTGYSAELCYYSAFDVPGWRNWQTRRTQNPVTARSCRFDSYARHQYSNARAPWLDTS